MTTRDEYLQKLHTKLDELNSEIDRLTNRGDKAAAEFKQEYHEQIETLKAKQSLARQKLDELQHAGESAWGDMKAGVDLAWSAIGEALDSARSRFK